MTGSSLYSVKKRIFLCKGFNQDFSGEVMATHQGTTSYTNSLAPSKQMFWGYFTSGGPDSLIQVERIINSKNTFL